MTVQNAGDRLFGWLIVIIIALQAIHEWVGLDWVRLPLLVCLLGIVVLMARKASRTGRVFLLVCIALTLALIAINDNWREVLWGVIVNAGFLASFFSALTILRNAASLSEAMSKAGGFLAAQPPGRRYISLSFGTQLFSLLLNYGSIQLLGALALSSAKNEPDEEIRKIRARRMLLAIQRGFISGLTWSPMAFSTAMAVSFIPGLNWLTVALPGLVSSAILLGAGWAIDTIFKPKLSRPRKSSGLTTDHRWTALIPLGVLLVAILVPVLSIELLLGIRSVGIVLVVVPLVSIIWLLLQFRNIGTLRRHLAAYVQTELPAFQPDLLLLMSAGYIGVIGSALLVPLMGEAGIDLTVVPGWLLLIIILWIMPVAGQFGGNPILTLSLVAPLLPDAALFGLHPSAFAVSMLCGWSLTGLTSPFTATNMLIARFGNIPTVDVGRVWNRLYFLVAVTLLSVWSLIYAYLIA
ncbi:hypothetical protein SAMN04515647_0251 [Cohaesibacter sp. ES.047]|uniref:hypothetical protein n=1 Tax=Cohaesibacter sp. ES.047 TaxID=1798205 RepID=UPI000BB6A3D6|nr:hypothetical protein [Cohaesibacter sp. ES.047]SNY90107.1 hypothetical protein SAMN04515647_0251 [Cohaesibacter sp. ES.047]